MIVLLLLWATVCFAQAPTYRVAGIVVNSATGTPLAPVRVKMENQIVESQDGRFAFDLPAGRYNLMAQLRGQRWQYMADGKASVVVGPDKRSDAVVFRLSPLAVITGRVVDQTGEAVRDADVHLFHSYVEQGRKKIGQVRDVETNAKGEYRFWNLTPGNYYLYVVGKPWWADGVATDTKPLGETAPAFAPVYYPNASTAQEAAVIAVGPAEEAHADFALRVVSGVNMNIKVSGNSGEDHGTFSIHTETFPGVDTEFRVRRFQGNDFPTHAIPPGNYRMRVATDGRVAADRKVASAIVAASPGAPNVDLAPHSRPQLSGVVKPSDFHYVSLRKQDRTIVMTQIQDGKFNFEDVPAGRYLVGLDGGDNWVKHLMADGAEVPSKLIEVTDDHAPRLEIVPAAGVVKLGGVALRDGQPAAGVTVLLLPDGGEAITNSDGSFTMPVAPGDYSLLAVDRPDLEYANPALVRPFLEHAKKVHLELSGDYKETVDVQ